MTPGPFETHLREAIALNRARAPRYAACTGGRSRAVSRRLVASESFLLPAARLLDRAAFRYHAAGVPLLDALFVSMEETPAFGCGAPRPLPPAYAAPDPRAQRRALVAAYWRGGFAGLGDALGASLDGRASAPHVDGMTRHILESLRRLAGLAPHAAASARQHGLASPAWLVGVLFVGHLAALGFAARLDARARPFNLGGVPIVVGDVPDIPPWTG